MKFLNQKTLLFSMLSFAFYTSALAQLHQATTHIDSLVYYLHHPTEIGRTLVVSHRGDWRNAPENSIQALQNCIAMGVDIMEIDLKQTKDGHLILMHDNTIDRTTNGKGFPKDYTLEELKKLRLKNGLGRLTDHQIPTFKEFLEVAHQKILIDVDKGYDYFIQVIKELRETETLHQAVINIEKDTPFDEVIRRYGAIPEDVVIMPVIAFDVDQKLTEKVLQSYFNSKKKSIIIQADWSDDKQVEHIDFKTWTQKGYGVWFNSLWPSLCGGHDDDKAVELHQETQTWQWLINRGAQILQTDRPKEMIQYLKK